MSARAVFRPALAEPSVGQTSTLLQRGARSEPDPGNNPVDNAAGRADAPLQKNCNRQATQSVAHVSENVNFLQLNLQHSKAATALLCQNITKLDNAVALVQEPWINNNRILGLNIKNSTIYRGSNSDSRTSIIVKGLQAYNLPQLGSKGTTVVCVTYSDKGRLQNLLAASVYMAIDKGLPVAELDNIIQYSESTGIPVVIAGDSIILHGDAKNKTLEDWQSVNSWQPLSWK